MPDTPDGRVTMAVLQQDIAYLRRELAAGLDAIRLELCGNRDAIRAVDAAVRQHDKQLLVVETFNDEQVKPVLKLVADQRVELAKLGALGGGFGLIFTIAAAVGKAAGAW